jgi:3-carboxy-cis,cis-muconate cycloisomerase
MVPPSDVAPHARPNARPVAPFDTPLYADLFGDAAMADLLDSRAELAALVRVEIALAEAQAAEGLIPAAAAAAIAALDPTELDRTDLDPGALSADTARAGVPVPGLVAGLRARLDEPAASCLHWGATSQDIADSALMVQMDAALSLLDDRIAGLIDRLADLARAHAGTAMLGRTRTQHATPISFGLIAAGWAAQIGRQRRRLARLRAQELAIQLGGAVGSLAVMGAKGPAVADRLAGALGLAPAAPWHTARDRITALGDGLAGLAGALGSFGADVARLAGGDVAELRLTGAGGSSTMPQKQNPVAGEALVTLARQAALHAGGLHQAALQPGQRDGAGWMLEWLNLRPLALTVGAASRIAGELAAGLTPDTARMAANLAASRGQVLAEAAAMALARHMPRSEAQALVGQAASQAAGAERHLIDVLSALTDAPVDWAGLKDPAGHLGPVDALIDRLLSEAGEGLRDPAGR